jgi:hypothetical protein
MLNSTRKRVAALVSALVLILIVITLTPTRIQAQIDLNTRVLNLENAIFGVAKTSAVTAATLTANGVVLGGGLGSAPATVAGIATDGTSVVNLGVAGTSVGGVGFNNATSGKVLLNPPTGALGTPTVTLPAITGSLGTGYSCGTIAANGACANTATAGTFHSVFGIATLASNTSTITGISPAFTSSSTFFCVANDITTRANPVQAIPASGSTVTFTNTTGATDNIQFLCQGY